MDAYVFLQVRPGRVEDVLVQLQNAKGVRAAVAVIGDCDIVAAAHGPDLVEIATNLLRSIHRIDGVERTITAPVVPGDVLGLMGGGLRTPVPMQHPGEACFVRIQVQAGAASSVVEALSELQDVSAVAALAGEFDVIAEIPYTWEQAARVVIDRIRSLPGVVSTRTLVAIPYLEPEDEDRDQFSAWT